jgi:hypothetical protein
VQRGKVDDEISSQVLHFGSLQGVALYTRMFLISKRRLSQYEVFINALKVSYSRFLAEPQ